MDHSKQEILLCKYMLRRRKNVNHHNTSSGSNHTLKMQIIGQSFCSIIVFTSQLVCRSPFDRLLTIHNMA
ncbi:unnamed protein product [Dicrocoelium dendriticum]|nr:unnamed protein product [Dicrocoelium dendriticum]